MSDSDDKTVPLEPLADAAPQPDATAPTLQADPAPSAPWMVAMTTDAPSVSHGRPRTRWAAIVWGLIIAGIAATTLAIVGSPERRQAVSDWAATLTPGAFWILSVLVVGVFILVLAVLALIRRAQRRSAV
ncbi:hypothetical protein G3T36_18560 [Diaminobutyricibacter tongyongensis]|uniref:Uncharacterized protein n=1 Tax=Leifsonia tongyongensis TaxID=1268043 RepID=A0A6L9Y2K4_9MICO|nr:hypothetical protein [Diaminobutyricibacter tongyongensis]NEN07863.1 hypothetical protein [Diaminobutyricibacter tongyongensis]